MGQALALADAFSIIVVVTFWVCLVFPVITGLFWKWWQTDFGWSYQAKVILLSLVLSGPAVHRMFGVPLDSVGYLWYLVISFGLVTPVLFWRMWVLWSTQRGERSRSPLAAVREWRRDRRQPPRDTGPQQRLRSTQR